MLQQNLSVDSVFKTEGGVSADICVQNVNELAKYGLVKTDEFGFVLTPLGMNSVHYLKIILLVQPLLTCVLSREDLNISTEKILLWRAEPGRIMEKFYLQFATMKAITKAPERSKMEDLLDILANAQELSCT